MSLVSRLFILPLIRYVSNTTVRQNLLQVWPLKTNWKIVKSFIINTFSPWLVVKDGHHDDAVYANIIKLATKYLMSIEVCACDVKTANQHGM